LAKSSAQLPRDLTLDTVFCDLGIDHWFEPVGISAAIAYWGDHNILDSVNYRASVYWRSARVTISGDAEFRNFELDFPATDRFPVRKTHFSATGLGLTTRFKLSDRTDLRIFGIDYDYDVNFRADENDRILELLSVSRLSLSTASSTIVRAPLSVLMSASDSGYSSLRRGRVRPIRK